MVELNSDTQIQYIWLNFNDYFSGFLTLYSVMINNNWNYIVDIYFFVTDGKYITVGLFFISFILINIYFITNILMAFMIDIYCSMEDHEIN